VPKRALSRALGEKKLNTA